MANQRGHRLAEGAEPVTVARSGGVWGNVEFARDLVEGEFGPNLEHDDFTLFERQAA